MTLGKGELRTKGLTEHVPGYSPRTIYRYAGKLAELGIVARREEPGVPSKVVHSLTEPAGRELYELVEAYADASLPRLPNGDIGAHAWGSLALLADLWESGMFDQLNRGPRTPTELARGEHGLSFHQVSRRATLFAIGGFLRESQESTRRRRYELTPQARRGMALIAGIGRWRRHHVVPEGMTGLNVDEVAALMRTVLPLVVLPDHSGKSFEIGISPCNGSGEGEQLVRAQVGSEGGVLSEPSPEGAPNASAHGKVPAWVDTVLDGPRNSLEIEGDAGLITQCLKRLHSALWGHVEDQAAPSALARL
ncbi:MAG TPA: winged helix-turn-helix transcriptional regulator [Solirubrobacterales bacterium]|nr:winged helix-turn-helix transcriptional regulator [Solirubrobacterales bacterium]